MVRVRANVYHRPYSQDLKDRIPVLHYELGYNINEICRHLGIKKSTVYSVLALHRILGVTYNPYPAPSHRNRKLTQADNTFLRSLIKWRPSLYLDELQEQLASRRGVHVSIPTLSRAMREMTFSRKRVSARAIERDAIRRAAYMNRIGEFVWDPEMLMFTDESAKDERTSFRRYGWSLLGTRCVSRVVFVRGVRYSILPVLTLDGLITWDIIEGPVTAERFVRFIREMVLPFTNPYPGPRSVLVLDNCSIHHSEELRKLVEDEAMCKLVFLPPYSPDYNPIEQAFSAIKAYLRRHWYDKTVSAIDQACSEITPKSAHGFFRASGYL